MRSAGIVLLAVLIPGCAQEIKLPANLDKLAAKAEESVDVTLDGPMLKLAARMMSDRDPDSARARKAISGLEGVYVRSYQFAFEGDYNPADLEAVRSQLRAPTWSRIVGVRSKYDEGNVDVYFKISADGKLGGVFLIAADPRELTIVNIVGNLDPDQLADLGGEFHIPKLDMRHWSVAGRNWK